MNSIVKSFLVLILASTFMFSCGLGSNSLSGSVSDFDWWNLSFDYVTITLRDEGLTVNYLRNVEGSAEPDIVAGITVLRESTAIVADERIDLAQFGSNVNRFVRVYDETGTLVEDSHPYPGVASGHIIFTRLSQSAGRPIEGEFYITFTTGYTLNGKFASDLIVQN